jgi:2'-5' RNA ligase
MVGDLVGRVFLAAPLPPEIRFALSEVVGGLPIPGRVVPPENWHITVRFLDTVDRVTFERFLAALDPLAETAFPISLDGLGAFPNPRQATVVWAAVGRGSEQLALLNEEAEEAALAAGLSPEERPFHPHLTLARARPPTDVRHLLDEELALSWRCEELVVYRTHLGRGGARYEPLDSIRLIG